MCFGRRNFLSAKRDGKARALTRSKTNADSAGVAVQNVPDKLGFHPHHSLHVDPANSLNLSSRPAAAVIVLRVEHVNDIVVEIDAVLVLGFSINSLVFAYLRQSLVIAELVQNRVVLEVVDLELIGCIAAKSFSDPLKGVAV